MPKSHLIFCSPPWSLLMGMLMLDQMQWPSENQTTLTYFPQTQEGRKSASDLLFPQGQANQICLFYTWPNTAFLPFEAQQWPGKHQSQTVQSFTQKLCDTWSSARQVGSVTMHVCFSVNISSDRLLYNY